MLGEHDRAGDFRAVEVKATSPKQARRYTWLPPLVADAVVSEGGAEGCRTPVGAILRVPGSFGYREPPSPPEYVETDF